MSTLTKPRISPESVTAKGWKNIDVTTNGKSFPGRNVHATEAIAKELSDAWIADTEKMAAAHPLSVIEIIDENDNHLYFWHDRWFTIQVPWGE